MHASLRQSIYMNPEAWAALAAVLILGAVSPGPSLLLVVRNTVRGGRRQGVLTGLGHGLGFGLYAFLAAIGMAAALSAHPMTARVLRWGASVLLVWLGVVFLRHGLRGPQEKRQGAAAPCPEHGAVAVHAPAGRIAFVQGFAVALLNPKIFAWLLALYTPFIKAQMEIGTLHRMSLLGMMTDGTWYVTVALVLSGTRALDRLRAKGHVLDIAMGVLMLVFAGLLLGGGV